MLLIVYNLPGTISYNEVKDLFKRNSGLDEVILDNLVDDKPGTKRVTVGLAEESDAAIFVRKINGMYIKGHQLFVENVRQKKASEQPYRSLASYLPDAQKISSNPVNNQSYDVNSQYNMPNQQYNMANQFMNPYQQLFDVNIMQYYSQQEPNTVVQSTPQAAQPMQPSLFQSNVPYYQQAQQQFQQDVAAYQPKNIRISVPNTQYPQRPAETLRRNDDIPKPQHSFQRSFGDNNKQSYPNDRDRKSGRDRDVSYGRNDRRDDKKFNYERETKFDQNRSRERSDYDEAKDKGRSDYSKSGPYSIDRRNFADTEPDLRSRIDDKVRQKDYTGYDSKSVYREKTQSRFSKKDAGPSARTRSKLTTNFNQFVNKLITKTNTHTSDRDSHRDSSTRNDQNQGGNMKRKLEAPQQSKPKKSTTFAVPPKQFVAPPAPTVSGNDKSTKKKLKFEELDNTQKMNRFNTWVHQVAADLAKEVIKSAGGVRHPAIVAELKKCIISRIFVIYDQRFAYAMPQIVKDYRKMYNTQDDYKFYIEVRDKVAENAKIIASEGTSQNQQILEGDSRVDATSGANGTTPVESSQIKSTPQSQPTFQKKMPPAGMTTQNKVSGPREQAATKSATPYVNQLKPSAPGKLPSYPGGLDKKKYNEIRLKAAEQFFEEDKIGQNLNEVDRKALKTEIAELCKVVTAACEEVDKENCVESKHRWANVRKSIEKIVSVQVAERMSNSPSFLKVRIQFRPKKPNREILEKFLMEYGVVSLKNSKRANMFIAGCKCFNGYDRLCSLKEAVVDEKHLIIKPFQLCGPPLKGKLKAKYGKNQNQVNNGDDDDDDDDDDDGDENDAQCDNSNENNEVSDHDKSVMIIEEKHDIIQIDDTDGAEGENDEAMEIEKDINEICKEFVDNIDENNSEIQNKDINEQSNTINDNNQSQPEDLAEETTKNDTNEDPENTQDKETFHDLIVGDDSYVILDDVDDENKNETITQETLQEVIQNTDITEEDLEDF
ncbi:unnamed protein product [Colias eurytheme]|nr:unnamed protein product [Colias eurytheme]